MNEPIRVIIADDHPVYRRGLAAALADDAGIRLIGEAGSGEEACALVDRLDRVDVVLMDLHMDGIGGIAATGALRERHPECAVLVLTMSAADETVDAALRVGARGYLVKGADQDRIVSAIRSVAAGELVVGAEVAHRVATTLSSLPVHIGAFPALTAREREVLDLIARGYDNARIARTLFLSEKTVRNHASGVFAKLEVGSRAEAVARARDAGLGS
ncbi:response regulator transcription factor [Parafrigoribacterium mesophilum]|uniref:response regulator transcription factor n=1 Tax=Parafrigoribacterium mesophilum TaxID=433646 RepID=UPI0031FDE637